MKKNIKKINLVLMCVVALIVFLAFCFPRKSMTSVVKNEKNTTSVEIYDNIVLNQKIISSFTLMKRIDIFLDDNKKFNNEIAQIDIFLNNKNVFSNHYLLNNQDDGVIHVNLKKAIVCNDRTQLHLVISCSNCTKDNSLKIINSAKFDKKNTYSINNQSKFFALKMNLFGYHYNYNFAICLTIFFFLLICLHFSFFNKKNFYTKKRYFIFEFVISFLSFITLYMNLIDYLYGYKLNIILVILNIIFFTILIKMVIVLIKNNIGKYHNLYLVLVIPIIFIYSIFVLPNYVPDEPAHFMRAYDLIDNNIFTNRKNANVPNDFIKYNLGTIDSYEDLNSVLLKSTNYRKEVVRSTSANVYPYILYFFVDIGVVIGKFFSLPIMLVVYLSRIINSLIMVTIGYFIVKKIPFGKNIAFIYLLNPMYLHEGCSVSADSLVNSICILFIATILEYKTNKSINKREVFFIAFLVLLLGFAKYIYIPLVLLIYLLFKNSNFIKRKYKKYIIIAAILTSIICFTLFIKNYIIPSINTSSLNIQKNISNVGIVGQLKYIVYNPNYAIKTIFSTINLMGPEYIKTFFGKYLGWLNISLNQYVTWIYAFLLISSPYICVGKENGYLCKRDKIMFLIMTLLLLFIVMLSMWLSWTPIGTSPISGIQGRYFMPFMILLFLALSSKTKKIEFKHYDVVVSVLIIIMNLSILSTFISYFK